MRNPARLGRALAAIAAALALGGAGGALAHHSFAMFDRTKKVTLQGTVKEFQWTNPHIFVQLLVAGPTGETEEWSIEGASPNMLYRQGWDNATFKAGDRVTIVMSPLKDGHHGGTFIYATLANGRTIGNPNGVAGPG